MLHFQGEHFEQIKSSINEQLKVSAESNGLIHYYGLAHTHTLGNEL